MTTSNVSFLLENLLSKHFEMNKGWLALKTRECIKTEI